MERSIAKNNISQLIELSHNTIERIGDCANFERKVNPKNILWETKATYKGWTLQKERLSNRVRIIDTKGVQRGNGSLTAMKDKMERLTSEDFLKPGDMIGVSRGTYEHYGIYIGHKRVIHYAGDGNDFSGKISIHEAPFEEFIKNSKNYFVISFAGKHPVRIKSTTKFIANDTFGCYSNKKYSIYSPEETLQRAYSRIGETKYSLIKNNCEHFAMWCKTGVSESTQVKQIIRYVLTNGVSITGLADSRADMIRYLT